MPEYTGSALTFLNGPSRAVTNSTSTYRERSTRLAPVGVTALRPAPAVDQNRVAVLRSTADRLGLRRISDLSRVADTMTLAAPPECARGPLCLPGPRGRHGVGFARFRPMAIRADIATVLLAGQADAGPLDTTSAYLTDSRLVLLRDDRALQPADNLVVLSTRVLKRFGPWVDAVDRVSERMTTADLVAMIRRVQLEGANPAAVAAERLRREQPAGDGHPASS